MPKYRKERQWDAYCWVNGRSEKYQISGTSPEEARQLLKERLRREGLTLESNITLTPTQDPSEAAKPEDLPPN